VTAPDATPDPTGGDEPDADDDTVFEQLDEAESLDDPDLADPLDEGVSPNEQPWGTDAWGVTPEEEESGEPLAGRLRREDPDLDDEDQDFFADDVGVDGAGASAEEAAIHLVDEER
jgi:hypothetical protein